MLDADGYRALRLGTVASGIWTVCAVLLVPLSISDVTGQPVASHLSPSAIWSVASLVEIAGAWRWTAFLAAFVTIASIPVLRWSPTPTLFAGSLITLLPLALTGHSSSGGSHDMATNSLLIHLAAATGAGILVVSSELPELLGVCDRILVVRAGRLTGEVARRDFSQERVMALAALG